MMETQECEITATDYPAEIAGGITTAHEIPNGESTTEILSTECETAMTRCPVERVSNLVGNSLNRLLGLLQGKSNGFLALWA